MSVKKFYNIGKNILFPICRSITGPGAKKTLQIIKSEFNDLKIKKEKSGKKIFDWVIPPEWQINNAFVTDKYNNKIINFKLNNLHVVNYSIPIKKQFTKKLLLNKIHTIKKKPNAIPYITSYYKKNWGFCVTHHHKKQIDKTYKENDKFFVQIDSKLKKEGILYYGELLLKGKSTQEILITTYICHPSMANNELSGPIVSMCLIEHFKKKKLEKSLRFIFVPETIGALNFLEKNLSKLKKNLIGGFNLSCIGDERKYGCILTKKENSLPDHAILEAYKKLNLKFKKYSFLKKGSDERQYNSPGIDLPIVSIFRSKYGEYPEYHTSLDDFTVVTEKGIKGGFTVAKEAIEILLKKIVPKNKILGEPFMQKRKLYSNINVSKNINPKRDYMNFLQYADGTLDLNQVSKKIKLDLGSTKKVYLILKKNKLVE
ncbi:DUF4910 domain-containing protein [Candidatus Pelagibacter sp.]|jgi:aminopeptidase-like protein|nr:DUF4910 domain-containing protein [Candidatus Pelagibacter sp.]